MIKFKILRAPDGAAGGGNDKQTQDKGAVPGETLTQVMPEGYTDSGSDIDELAGGEPAKPAQQAAPPEDKPEDVPGDDKPEDDKAEPPDATEPPKPFTPKQKLPKRDVANLRTAYEQTKTEKETLGKKVLELEEQLKKTKDTDDRQALLDRISTLEKERGELDTEVKSTRYERSAEYRDQYVKPLAQAFENVLTDLGELSIQADDGSERAATKDDFDILLNLDLRKATEKANELFGPVAPQIMAHRNQVIRLRKAAQKAVDDHKTHAEKYEADRRQKTAEESQRRRQLWDETTKDLVSKFPEWYAPDEKGDPEGTKAQQKNLAIFDALMNPQSGLTPEQRIKAAASLRQKAGAFDKMALRLNATLKRVEELETALEEYETSGEGGEKGGSGGGNGNPNMPAGYKTADDELDALASSR